MASRTACLVVCLLLIGPTVSQQLPSSNSGAAATGLPLPKPNNNSSDICTICSCSGKAVTCDSKDKLNDIVNIRVPEDYNILDLSKNLLTRIHQESFIEGIDVTELKLAYNEIKSIAQFAFAAFKNLTRLTLSHNHLAVLEDDSLAGLPHLESLDLSMNKFRRLNPEYLAPLSNLKYLVLDNNRIEGLHGSIFRNNTKLTHLQMKKLSISKLDEALFQYTPKITVLHLDDNFLETVPEKALAKLPVLEILTLTGNPIVYLGPFSFPKLPQLQHLVLHDMSHLLEIQIYAFNQLPMLRTLKIQNCKALYYIDPKAFALEMKNDPVRLPSVKSLVIHDTAITTLSQNMLDWEEIVDLDLASNKFHCNCNFSWAIEVVKKHDVNLNIRCHSPQRLAEHIIGRLQTTDMLCDDFSPFKHAIQSRDHHHSPPGLKGFSVLHIVVLIMLAATIVLSVLLIMSVKRRGFLYRKLGKPQPVYAGGENVLYMRTTIDND